MLMSSDIFTKQDDKYITYLCCKKCQALFFTKREVLKHEKQCSGTKILDGSKGGSQMYAYQSSYLKGFVDCVLNCSHKDTCPLLTRPNEDALGSGIVTNVVSRKGLTITVTEPRKEKKSPVKSRAKSHTQRPNSDNDDIKEEETDDDWAMCSDNEQLQTDMYNPSRSSSSNQVALPSKGSTMQTRRKTPLKTAEPPPPRTKARPSVKKGSSSSRLHTVAEVRKLLPSFYSQDDKLNREPRVVLERLEPKNIPDDGKRTGMKQKKRPARRSAALGRSIQKESLFSQPLSDSGDDYMPGSSPPASDDDDYTPDSTNPLQQTPGRHVGTVLKVALPFSKASKLSHKQGIKMLTPIRKTASNVNFDKSKENQTPRMKNPERESTSESQEHEIEDVKPRILSAEELKWKKIAEEKYAPIKPRPIGMPSNVVRVIPFSGDLQGLLSQVIIPVAPQNPPLTVPENDTHTGHTIEAVGEVTVQTNGNPSNSTLPDPEPKAIYDTVIQDDHIEEVGPYNSGPDVGEDDEIEQVIHIHGDNDNDKIDTVEEDGITVSPDRVDLRKGDHSYDLKKVPLKKKHKKRSAKPPHHCPHCSYRTFHKLRMHVHLKGHELVEKQKNKNRLSKALQANAREERWFGCNKCKFQTPHGSSIRSHIMAHLGINPWECVICGKRGQTENHIALHVKWRHRHYMYADPKDAAIRHDVNITISTRQYRIPRPRDPASARMWRQPPNKYAFSKALKGKGKSKGRGKTTPALRRMFSDNSPSQAQQFTPPSKDIMPSVQCRWCGFWSNDMKALDHHMLSHTRSRLWQCAICGHEDSTETGLKDHINSNHPRISFEAVAIKLGEREEVPEPPPPPPSVPRPIIITTPSPKKRKQVKGTTPTNLSVTPAPQEIAVTDEEAQLIENLLNMTPSQNLVVATEEVSTTYMPIPITSTYIQPENEIPLAESLDVDTDSSKMYVTVPVEIYGCDQCDFKAQNATRFKQHLISHQGIKPWQCKICNAGDSNKGAMMKHIENVHPDHLHKPLAAVIDMAKSITINLDEYKVVAKRRRLNKDFKK